LKYQLNKYFSLTNAKINKRRGLRFMWKNNRRFFFYREPNPQFPTQKFGND